MAEPMSRQFLLSRGHCCLMNCKNCPYEESLTKEGQKVNDIGLKPTPSKESEEESHRRASASDKGRNFPQMWQERQGERAGPGGKRERQVFAASREERLGIWQS